MMMELLNTMFYNNIKDNVIKIYDYAIVTNDDLI